MMWLNKLIDFWWRKKKMPRDKSTEYYENLFLTMKILPEKESRVISIREDIIRNFSRYSYVSNLVGLPWEVIGAIHHMECSGDFRLGLHCGQPWNEETTWVPKGRGPFTSWEMAAVDAILMKSHLLKEEWTSGDIGYFLEAYNGFGYANKDKGSPYLWSFTNHGVGTGKYVSDGTYDSDAVSSQCGAMPIIKSLMEENRLLVDPREIIYISPSDYSEYALEFQKFANKIFEMRGEDKRIVVDGYPGRNTQIAIEKIFGRIIR